MNILFYMNIADKPFLFRTKKALGAHNVWLYNSFSMLTEVVMRAKEKQAEWIITTRQDLLVALCKAEGYTSREEIKINDYIGSIFHYKGLKVLILPPLASIVRSSSTAGQFIFDRMASKLDGRGFDWFEQTEFNYTKATPANIEALYEVAANAKYLAIDCETLPDEKLLDCVGYTAVLWDATAKHFTTTSFTLPLDDMFMLSWIRKLNSLPAPKILQNGKYDLAYFLRYDCLFDNYLFDTINLFHSYYAELPKDLGFQSAFFIRNFKYWKHEAQTGSREDKLAYCAKDTWVTANVMLAAITEMPQWAINNYLMEFPVVAPSFYVESLGIKADPAQLQAVKARKQEELARSLAGLRKMTSSGFNPNSSQQVVSLLKILGHTTITSSDDKTMQKVAFLDPLAGVLIEKIVECREASKAISTYLDEGKLYWNAQGTVARILYAVNPHGAETARNASRSHQLSSKKQKIGLQIQNITRSESKDPNDNIKSFFVADTGFVIGEADYAQAESRDTAYLSGDTALIAAVDGPYDFHGLNASAFFGRPYETIIKTTIHEDGTSSHETLDKPLRNLAKPVNHGANYNMGEEVLVQTMGLKRVFQAAKMLNLPAGLGAKGIASWLLAAFERTYPVIKKQWYDKVVAAVEGSHMLVSPVVGKYSWTRYCFMRVISSEGRINKPALNAYVAHPPQNLNALTLNASFKAVFYEVQLPNPDTFRLNAQIHDSILFQYRVGHEYLQEEVRKRMERPVKVTDTFGITRTLIVPVDIKGGKAAWG